MKPMKTNAIHFILLFNCCAPRFELLVHRHITNYGRRMIYWTHHRLIGDFVNGYFMCASNNNMGHGLMADVDGLCGASVGCIYLYLVVAWPSITRRFANGFNDIKLRNRMSQLLSKNNQLLLAISESMEMFSLPNHFRAGNNVCSVAACVERGWRSTGIAHIRWTISHFTAHFETRLFWFFFMCNAKCERLWFITFIGAVQNWPPVFVNGIHTRSQDNMNGRLL